MSKNSWGPQCYGIWMGNCKLSLAPFKWSSGCILLLLLLGKGVYTFVLSFLSYSWITSESIVLFQSNLKCQRWQLCPCVTRENQKWKESRDRVSLSAKGRCSLAPSPSAWPVGQLTPCPAASLPLRDDVTWEGREISSVQGLRNKSIRSH